MSESDIGVQTADLTDIPDLVRLEKATFVTSDGLLSERAFRYHIKRGNLCLTARSAETDELAGYVLVLPHRKSARIYSLAVSGKFQRRGIARKLLQEVLHETRQRDIPLVKLEVRRENTQAIALYQSLGFHIQNIRQNYYGSKEDAVVMQCKSTRD